MPVYEYHCDACGKDFEATQRMSDPPLTICSCGVSGQVHRLLSAGTGLIFKGSGFYITDYKNGKGDGSSKSESPTPAKSEPAAATTSGGGHSCGSGCGCGK